MTVAVAAGRVDMGVRISVKVLAKNHRNIIYIVLFTIRGCHRDN